MLIFRVPSEQLYQEYILGLLYCQNFRSGRRSNCKYYTSKNLYFLKRSFRPAVMFAGQRKGLAFAMKDGDKVIVTGSVDVYERDGKYQLYARSSQLEGAGILYEKFLALKEELEEMGMFSEEYKQPIPRFARRLGVVTAPTGAAAGYSEYFLSQESLCGDYSLSCACAGRGSEGQHCERDSCVG